MKKIKEKQAVYEAPQCSGLSLGVGGLLCQSNISMVMLAGFETESSFSYGADD